jgi:hypothetical protein
MNAFFVKDKAGPSRKVNTKRKTPYFLFEKEQKREILLLGITGILVHLLLVYLFPTPKACADTFHYLVAASYHQISVYRPYGYSAALVFLKTFSEGTYIVFLAQYLFSFCFLCFLFIHHKVPVQATQRLRTDSLYPVFYPYLIQSCSAIPLELCDQ